MAQYTKPPHRTSGMVLAIYRSSSHINPPFANPNIADLSVTHSRYWHPLLPAMLPRNHHLKHLSPSHKSFPFKTSKKFKVNQQRRVELSSKKKRREAHSPFQVANYGVQIKWEAIYFLCTLQISHVQWDLNLAKYQPRYGSPFDWAIQVTKVRIHLPIHKLHISALKK